MSRAYLPRIPVCVRRRVNGEETDRFPFPTVPEKAEPVFKYMDGRGCAVSGARRREDLPAAAENYVSDGPERDSIILR